MSIPVAQRRAIDEAEADSRTFIDWWHANGGYEGAKARSKSRPPFVDETFRPRTASGHMPFPHRHCGEWR